MSLILILLLIVCGAAGCGTEPAPDSNAAANAVTASANAPCDSVARVGYLPERILEASGVAPSHAHPGILWTHNDDDLVVFAIDTLGKQHARIRLATGAPGAPEPVVDAEDIALARCGNSDCIYFADIGDNYAVRKAIRIFRFPEPDPAKDSVAHVMDVFTANYPDGAARDAEAIFILPPERPFIVTKGRSSPVSLYAYPGPLRPGVVTLKHIQDFTPGLVQFPQMVTGGSASYDGSRVALRSYGFLRLYTPMAGDSLQPIHADSLALTAVHEFQGEGIALRDDGTVFLVGEKGLDTVPPSLIRMKCRP